MTSAELSRFLGRMHRMWAGPSLPFPGRTPDAAYATYVHYRSTQPLRVPDAGDFLWLEAAGEPPSFEGLPVTTLASPAFDDQPDIVPFDASALHERLGNSAPADVVAFADCRLSRFVPTVTDCFLDLAQDVVAVPGGRLVHLLADSQGILHWLLLVGDDGSHAVLVTDQWFGYDLGDETPRLKLDGPPQFGVVAATFTEFIWRFWLDNTIWLLVEDDQPLSTDQRRYLDALVSLFPA